MKYLKKFNESSEPKFTTDEKQIRIIVRNILQDTVKRHGYFPEYDISDDGSVNVYGPVFIYGQTYENLPIKFGHVDGSFKIENCRNLKNLHGLPRTITGSLCIESCGITSLEGGPERVKTLQEGGNSGSVYIGWCENLKSLKGFPAVGLQGGNIPSITVDYGLGSRVLSSGNIQLQRLPIESLEGLPSEIGGNLSLQALDKLTDLVGLPERIGGYLNIFKIENLISTRGITRLISGQLRIDSCRNLAFPDDLRDVQAESFSIDYTGLNELISAFPGFKGFQDSLDYNYIRRGPNNQPLIDHFRFTQALEECAEEVGPNYPFFRRFGGTYKMVNDEGIEVNPDGTPME